MDFLHRIETKFQQVKLSLKQLQNNNTAKIKCFHADYVLRLIKECRKELDDGEQKMIKLSNQYKAAYEKELKQGSKK
ncbi:MAG: hypothetical protein KDH96_00615 [Candidatus Riesia sp.]|nr:hypothetical protein [Candidatus Riesia sp.]